MQNNTLVGTLQILIAAALWGTMGVAGITLNKLQFTGMEIASIRLVGAACFLLLALPLFWPHLKTLTPKKIPFLILQSLLGMFILSASYFSAISLIGSALAVALLYTSPIWSLIFARIILGEGINKAGIILTLCAVTGVALTLSGDTKLSVLGLALGLTSGASYALYGVLGKRAMQANHHPMVVLFTSIIFSAIAFAFTPAFLSAATKLHQNIGIQSLSTSLYLVTFGTILPYFLFIRGLQKMPATSASIFTTTEPVVAIILAALLLGEILIWQQYFGIMLIIGAAFFNAVLAKKRAKIEFPAPTQ